MNVVGNLDRGLLIEGRAGLFDEGVVQLVVQLVVLFCRLPRIVVAGRAVQNRSQVQPTGLRGVSVSLPKQVGTPHHLVNGAHPKIRHDLAQLLRHKVHVAHHVLGLAHELLAQLRVLRGDAHRAGVAVTLPQHNAPQTDEGRGAKAKFFASQQRRHGHVPPGFEAAVHPEADAGAEVVFEKHLLRLRHAQLPREARRLDGGLRRRARPAGLSADEEGVGLRLGHARGDDPDAGRRHELHVHVRRRVGALEVVDELREVLDRVNVVVGRRRNERHPRGRVARLGDEVVDLLPRQVAALPRLRALRHFDFDGVSTVEVGARDPEAPTGHLLDRTFALGAEAVDLLAALAGAGPPANPIHRDGERLVGLRTEGAKRHGGREEALDDGLGGLHLGERNGPVGVRVEVEQAPQRLVLGRLIIDQSGKLVVRPAVVLPHRMLEPADRLRVPLMVLPIPSPVQLAPALQVRRARQRVPKRLLVTIAQVGLQLVDARPLNS
jgi:hypothetical protein